MYGRGDLRQIRKRSQKGKGMKYKNSKIDYDGIKFDSKKEATRYAELKILEKAGEIKNLQLQRPFELIPRQKIDGKVVERACKYIADFVYQERIPGGWQLVVEDTKGFRTEAYKIKRKLMLQKYGIKIRER